MLKNKKFISIISFILIFCLVFTNQSIAEAANRYQSNELIMLYPQSKFLLISLTILYNKPN